MAGIGFRALRNRRQRQAAPGRRDDKTAVNSLDSRSSDTAPDSDNGGVGFLSFYPASQAGAIHNADFVRSGNSPYRKSSDERLFRLPLWNQEKVVRMRPPRTFQFRKTGPRHFLGTALMFALTALTAQLGSGGDRRDPDRGAGWT